MHCTHALYSYTVLMHCTHTLYSYTVLVHCTHTYWYTVLTLYNLFAMQMGAVVGAFTIAREQMGEMMKQDS
jgi:hypothetical protein